LKCFCKAYVLSEDKDFAAATIHAIGRCASNIKEVADNCLTGLVNLMSKKDGTRRNQIFQFSSFFLIFYCKFQETIVAESVVVIKRLLQSNVIFLHFYFKWFWQTVHSLLKMSEIDF
jgi:AP-3 complex subunit beta